MEKLRDELRAHQEAKIDIIKWKLILVSTLAAIGIGLTDSNQIPNIELVLCCIPFVCIYADLMLAHLTIIITVIGEFMRSKEDKSDPLVSYEEFSYNVRELPNNNGKTVNAFELESVVIVKSSLIFSIILIIYAIVQSSQDTSVFIGIAGVLGITFTMLVQLRYNKLIDLVRNKISKNTFSQLKPQSPASCE